MNRKSLERILLLALNIAGIGAALTLLVKWPLWTVLGAVVHFGVTHVIFAAVMNYMRVRDDDSRRDDKLFAPEVQTVAYAALGLGLLLDVALNFMWTPIAALRFAPEFTFSQTMEEWMLRGTGYRQKLAAVVRPRWLSPYDLSGKHG